MDVYDVDVATDEVLRWVKEDAKRPRPTLWVRASKTYEVPEQFARVVPGIEESGDLAEVEVTGSLDLWPRRGVSGWRLRIGVTDTIGIESGARDEDYEDDEDMTVEAFEEMCPAPGKGTVEITVATDDAAGKSRFDRWLARRTRRPRPRKEGGRLFHVRRHQRRRSERNAS